MALKLLNVKSGDFVFGSTLTFVATCNLIIPEGGQPIFIDSESETMSMSPIALEKAFKHYEKKNVECIEL